MTIKNTQIEAGDTEIHTQLTNPLLLPPQVKMQYLHFRSHANYFLLPWKIPEEISRRSMFFHN